MNKYKIFNANRVRLFYVSEECGAIKNENFGEMATGKEIIPNFVACTTSRHATYSTCRE